MKSKLRLLSLLAVLGLLLPLLAACGGETPTNTAVAVPATATTAPAAATNTTAPEAPAATNTTAPEAPAATATTAEEEPTEAVEEPTEATDAPPTATTQPTVVSSGEGCAAGSTQVKWYVGVGTGTDPLQIEVQNDWVNNYNTSQTENCVILQVVPNVNAVATLRTLIAGGQAPDIVGPTGKVGRASFKGAWADLEPLIEAAGVDLSAYDPALIEFTKDEGVLVGVPFALFPSMVFYNKDMFDEARVPYPPHKVGETYDGKPWNLDTLVELAKLMTVDANGSDATMAEFDPENIVQFGYWEQFSSARETGVLFGPDLPYEGTTGNYTAKIPETWRTAFHWYYDGMWKEHFMPNGDQQASDLLGGNPFASGNVAMARSHTWYTCCFLGDFKERNIHWDVAVVPEINGQITAPLHGDTFAILEDSKVKEAAFEVMMEMVAAPELFATYGGMPALESERQAFFDTKNEEAAPSTPDWEVAEQMIAYPDVPNHEAWTPNLVKAQDVWGAFFALLSSTPDLDVDAELTKVQEALDALYDEAEAAGE